MSSGRANDRHGHSVPCGVLLSAGPTEVKLKLTRLSGSSERTLGELDVDGIKFATIERPWFENPAGPGGMPRQSCVPLGEYIVRPHHSIHFPNTYAIVCPNLGIWYQPGDIPAGQKWGRSAILMHSAGFVRHVIGCIGIGKQHFNAGGEDGITSGFAAMRQLNVLLNRNTHTLEIV